MKKIISKERLEQINIIVFYGALWGIIEATLGYILHFVPQLISGMVLFPIAAAIMMRAARRLGKAQYIFYIAMITALIKGINLLLPGLPPIKTINPMIAILLEAAVMVLVYPLLVKGLKYRMLGVFAAALGWRALFVMSLMVTYLLTGFLARQITSLSKGTEFIVVSGILSSIILLGTLYIEEKSAGISLRIRFSYGLLMLLLAVGLQIGL